MDSRVVDGGMPTSIYSPSLSRHSPPPLQPSFMHHSSYPATPSPPRPCCQQPRPYPQAAALVTGARVAERRRKHEPTSPQLITRKTSSLRHVTKHTGIVSATCETSTDLEEAREKDKVVRSVRRTDSLARIQPQRERCRPVRQAGYTQGIQHGRFNSRRIKSDAGTESLENCCYVD